MKLFLNVCLLPFVIVLCVVSASGSDLSEVADSVPTFFKILDKDGLDGVELHVLSAYKIYDFKPQLRDLQKAAGVDIAAYLFYSNLTPNVKKGMSHYDLWESDAVISRIEKRLSSYYKDKKKRQDILLLWLQSVKSRMHLYYLEHQN